MGGEVALEEVTQLWEKFLFKPKDDYVTITGLSEILPKSAESRAEHYERLKIIQDNLRHDKEGDLKLSKSFTPKIVVGSDDEFESEAGADEIENESKHHPVIEMEDLNHLEEIFHFSKRDPGPKDNIMTIEELQQHREYIRKREIINENIHHRVDEAIEDIFGFEGSRSEGFLSEETGSYSPVTHKRLPNQTEAGGVIIPSERQQNNDLDELLPETWEINLSDAPASSNRSRNHIEETDPESFWNNHQYSRTSRDFISLTSVETKRLDVDQETERFQNMMKEMIDFEEVSQKVPQQKNSDF